jgi:filamentous hemagglutinin family protein
LLGAAVALCFAAPAAYANPTGGAVANGSASFARSGSTLNVTNTPGAIINWQQFSIGQNEVTRFIQQSAASSVLNRVVGANPSAILGTLSSNGRVFLVNPSGITIGRGAMIDVAGFAASTLNLSDADFLSGRLLFQGTGAEGKLTNAGSIKTADGGHVYLVAPNVENQKGAVVTSPKGEVLIAAGKTVELVNSREPDIRVEFTAAGEAVNAGTLVAASGNIGIYGTLVRNSGRVSAARALVGDGGKIVFRAAQDALLEAGSQVEAGGDKGGSVQVLGRRVGVLDGASIDASGDKGGGTVLVGGDFQGGNAQVQNAWRTYFGAESAIHADALLEGDGGKVVLWSNDITRAYGTISARGGAQGGDGGFVEVSGKNLLDFLARVDVGSPRGAAGTVLLDPRDITIQDTGGANNAQVTAPATDTSILFADGGTGDFTLNDEALEALSGNVVLQASRDITLNNNLSGGLTLTNPGQGITLQAGRNITIGSAITTQGGAIHLEADSPHAPATGSTDGRAPADGVGQLSITANGALNSNGGHITLIGGGDPILGGGGIALSENHPINAGAGDIDVALSGNAPLGVGVLGLLTQILGNPMDELHTTGALVIGTATTAGSNGQGAGGQTLLASSITNIYPGSAIDLTSQSGSSFTLTAGSGGIVLDQPLTTFQPTNITTTGNLTINDPINTSNNNLTLTAANVTTGSNGSINTGSGACSGPGCPVSTIFWDGGQGTSNWFDANNWSSNTLPTGTDDVTIGSGFGSIQIGASGAVAKSLIANSGIQLSGSGSLNLANASQFADVFTLSGGSLLGTGSASVTGPNGALAWSGGSMSGAGSFQLVSGRSGTLTNALVLNRAFQNEGLLTLSGASISGTGAFANAGTLTAAASTSNSISNAFQNIAGTIAGTIQVNGSLTLPSFSANDGTLNVAAGGSFSTGGGSLANLATGVIVADGAFSVGSGTFDNSGSAAFNGTASMGTLTLSAGTVNGTGDLTVNTDFNESGGALGTTFSDLSLTRSGAFAVSGFTAVDSIALHAGGAVTLNGAVSTTTGGGDSIVINGTSFTNNAGAAALNPGAGRFLVWSRNPASDNRGGQAYDFKQYNASFGSSSVLGSGNGFLYTTAPSVTPGLTGEVGKQYDATTAAALAAGNYSVSGAIDGDTVTLNNPVAGIYADKNVGSGINVSASGIFIAGASNGAATVYGYQLGGSTANANVGSITQAPLSVTADNASKTYGQTVSFAGSEFTSSGLQGGETIGSVSLSSTGAAAAAGVSGSPYAIPPSNATGGTFSAGNYSITYNNGSLTIAPAALTVTADNQTREYGLANPTLTGTLTGLVNGDAASVVSGLTYGTAATQASNVGGHAITSSGGTATNYTITVRNDGTLSITPATLTYVASAASRAFGDANPLLDGQVSGFVNGESLGTATSGTAQWLTPADASSPAGAYAINGSGLTALNGNYTFQQAAGNMSALTVTGSLVIPPSALNPPPPTAPSGSQQPEVPNLGTGNLLNVNTGENVPVQRNSLPDPGIYLNQDGGSVMVVGQGNAATQLVLPSVNYAPGYYVNSETGFLYVVNEDTQLDPGVYYNRESQTVLVVSSNSDGNVTVSSADIKEAVQTVASGAGGRRVASIACK